jgi:hypothetical protein
MMNPVVSMRRPTRSPALLLGIQVIVGRMNLGSQNTRNAISSAKYSIARCGSRNLLFARSRTPFSYKQFSALLSFQPFRLESFVHSLRVTSSNLLDTFPSNTFRLTISLVVGKIQIHWLTWDFLW